MNTKMNNKGFTLIEILVALSISSILMLALLTIMITSSKSYEQTTDEVSLENESQTSMNFINNLLSKAQYIEYNEKTNTTAKKKYMVELEQDKYGKSDSSKNSDRWSSILGSTVNNYTYLAIGTDFSYDSSTTTYSMIMHYILYNNDKLYYYKTDASDMNISSTSLSIVADNELLDDKKDDLDGIVAGGNKYLMTNYVSTSNGFYIGFDEELTKDDAGNDMLSNLKINVYLNLQGNHSKYNAVTTAVPRNCMAYIY